MKQIKLSQGQIALVDDSDFERLNQWNWYARKHRHTYYAARNVRVGSKRRLIQMHRQIAEASFGQMIDHKDNNGLNNQKENLRYCSNGQNKMNSKKRKKSNSVFKGVTRRKTSKKWTAKITINKRRIQIGSFDNETEAAKAYDKQALRLFGEFAELNFPKGAVK